MDPADTYDRTAALEYVDGDVSLLALLAGQFRTDSTALLEELNRAVADSDAPTVQRVAHTLKSNAALFVAQRAVDAALRVEELAKAGDVAAASQACESMRVEFGALREAVAPLAEESKP